MNSALLERSLSKWSKWIVTSLLLVTPLASQAQEMPEWAAPSTLEERLSPTHAERALPIDRAEFMGPPDFPDAPLDPAGLALLAAAGGLLAARRLRQSDRA